MYKVDNRTSIQYGKNQISDDIKTIGNYTEMAVRETSYRKQINSIYGSASVGYKHTYYLEGTIRGDQSSTLPVNNNTYVYPSVSTSIVWSEFLKDKKWISYGKFRASFAEVGSDTDPYLLNLNYTNALFAYTGKAESYISNTIKPNDNLKPTRTNSFELGLEMKFFRNRLGIDVTYYNQTSRDQIIQLATSAATGYQKERCQYSLSAGHTCCTGLDVIHGYETLFPVPLGLSCTWDME